MELVQKQSKFRSEKTVAFVDVSIGAGNISTSTNVIGFTTYHRFRNGDAVVYNSNSQTAIGIGTTSDSQVRDAYLVNNSIYYVHVESLTEITLHNKQTDALAGVSTINITTFGEGNQYFTTVKRKIFFLQYPLNLVVVDTLTIQLNYLPLVLALVRIKLILQIMDLTPEK